MKNMTKALTLISSVLHSRTGKLIIMVAVLALFILAAGAPNATIGIGK